MAGNTEEEEEALRKSEQVGDSTEHLRFSWAVSNATLVQCLGLDLQGKLLSKADLSH